MADEKVQINFKTDPDVREALSVHASKRLRTVPNLVDYIVREWLESQETANAS